MMSPHGIIMSKPTQPMRRTDYEDPHMYNDVIFQSEYAKNAYFMRPAPINRINYQQVRTKPIYGNPPDHFRPYNPHFDDEDESGDSEDSDDGDVLDSNSESSSEDSDREEVMGQREHARMKQKR